MTRPLRPLLLCLLAALALASPPAAAVATATRPAPTPTSTRCSPTRSRATRRSSRASSTCPCTSTPRTPRASAAPSRSSIAGPFQTEGKQKLPKFDIDFAFEGAGQSIKAGLTSTGTKGFVSFQGNEYAVTDQVFKQFKAGYEQAQQKGNKKNQSLSSLGLDPRAWLTNPKNEGDAKVGDDDMIKITGGIDVNKLLDDVNQALQKTRELGVQGTQSLPTQLTAAQRKQVADAVKDPKVEIYTGKDDKILRRMVVSLGIVAPEELELTQRVGRLQARLLDLRPQRGPGDLRALRRQAVRPAALEARRPRPRRPGRRERRSGSGPPAPARRGANNANLEKYSKCVRTPAATPPRRRSAPTC